MQVKGKNKRRYIHRPLYHHFCQVTDLISENKYQIRINRISGRISGSSPKTKGIYSGTVTIISESFILIAIILFELSSGQTNQQTHKQTNKHTNKRYWKHYLSDFVGGGNNPTNARAHLLTTHCVHMYTLPDAKYKIKIFDWR